MISTVTLNPAVDRVLFLDRLEKNVTNRVQSIQDTIGGKGTHVSINLKALGVGNRAYGVCHGATGRQIISHLEKNGLDVRFLYREAPDSRVNYLLIEQDGDCTVIAEKGVCLEAGDLEALAQKMRADFAPGDWLVLSGDASNCPPTAYNDLLSALADRRPRVFLDTSGPSLASCITAAPYLIKPNLDELSGLCGRPIACDPDDILAAVDSLDPYGVEVVAVSLGGEGSVVRTEDGVFRAVPPEARVVNTVGCGDCFLAGLLYGFSAGLPAEECIRAATAVSAATAESPLSVGFSPARAKQLAGQVKVSRLR